MGRLRPGLSLGSAASDVALADVSYDGDELSFTVARTSADAEQLAVGVWVDGQPVSLGGEAVAQAGAGDVSLGELVDIGSVAGAEDTLRLPVDADDIVTLRIVHVVDGTVRSLTQMAVALPDADPEVAAAGLPSVDAAGQVAGQVDATTGGTDGSAGVEAEAGVRPARSWCPASRCRRCPSLPTLPSVPASPCRRCPRRPPRSRGRSPTTCRDDPAPAASVHSGGGRSPNQVVAPIGDRIQAHPARRTGHPTGRGYHLAPPSGGASPVAGPEVLRVNPLAHPDHDLQRCSHGRRRVGKPGWRSRDDEDESPGCLRSFDTEFIRRPRGPRFWPPDSPRPAGRRRHGRHPSRGAPAVGDRHS